MMLAHRNARLARGVGETQGLPGTPNVGVGGASRDGWRGRRMGARGSAGGGRVVDQRGNANGLFHLERRGVDDVEEGGVLNK